MYSSSETAATLCTLLHPASVQPVLLLGPKLPQSFPLTLRRWSPGGAVGTAATEEGNNDGSSNGLVIPVAVSTGLLRDNTG